MIIFPNRYLDELSLLEPLLNCLNAAYIWNLDLALPLREKWNGRTSGTGVPLPFHASSLAPAMRAGLRPLSATWASRSCLWTLMVGYRSDPRFSGLPPSQTRRAACVNGQVRTGVTLLHQQQLLQGHKLRWRL